MHRSERKGGWVQTYSAQRFYPLDPRESEVHINDIAQSLATSTRYNGHALRPYWIATHCCVLSDYVMLEHNGTPEDGLVALMHDASEAYLTDVVRPLKPHLTNYAEIEAEVERVVARRFQLPYPWPKWLHELDARIVVDEHRQVMAPGLEWPIDALEPLGVRIPDWDWREAYYQFMLRFRTLSENRG